MANFYAPNTPLINYFFYKAPFVQNNYSLVSSALASGGFDFSVNDIVVLIPQSNMGYTVPVSIKVTSVNDTSFAQKITSIIINGGFTGGTGYAVNDLITLNMFDSLNNPIATYFDAQIKVTSIGVGGTITGVTILNNGAYFGTTASYLTQNTTNGTGSGIHIGNTAFTTEFLPGSIATYSTLSVGNFIPPTPTLLVQLSTNGSGMGCDLTTLIFSPDIQPPGPNIPLSGGFIFFYQDANRTVQANTYSDVSDPANPVINPNPLRLGSSGDCPIFYLEDIEYYIVITDNTGDQSNPVQVIEHYSPSEIVGGLSTFNENYTVNPQFNYPIEFWKNTEEVGFISQSLTTVAWGWEFLQDNDTDSLNYVTFNNIAGQQIEGSPINEIVLTSSTVSSTEQTKDFRTFLGTVDFNQGNVITFCAEMESQNGNTVNVNLILELNYGTDGSPSAFILLNTFNVGISRQKYAFSFTMPSIISLSIGEGNYSALRIQPGLQAICQFGMTNVQTLPGIEISPVFADESEGFSKAQIVGDAIQINGAGLYENYSSYYYTNGLIIPYADTGEITLAPTNLLQNFRVVCDGSSYFVKDYGPNNIPFQRLYNAIGTEFGGGGDLIVTSSGNVVTFTSSTGAIENSPYTAGTTSFTVTNTIAGLKFGVSFVNNFNNTITGTFHYNFAPVQTAPVFGLGSINPAFPNSGNGLMTYWGGANNKINPNNMSFGTINPGSGVSQAQVLITFNSNNPADYQTKFFRNPYPPLPNFTAIQASSFIEFATFANNVRQISPTEINATLGFSLDGAWSDYIGQTYPFSVRIISALAGSGSLVPFSSSVSMAINIQTFINTVANPFVWTVTVNSAPLASQYFLYSSGTADFYAWFTVNGSGTDPAIVGRTGTEIPIFTGQSTTTIAEIIAETLNTAAFQVPNIPPILSGAVSYFINL